MAGLESPTSIQVRRALRLVRPHTPDELHGYCRAVLGFDVPRLARLEGHCAPFDYLCHAFFETGDVRDCVVWANRGGGKTRFGAIATLLDLLFKPGIQVRILGGSLEQSSRMHMYLREMIEGDTFGDLLEGKATGRHIQLTNGSRVEVQAQSEQSVRGLRVQKLRCDEVELFTPEVWQAAQFVTRSAWCGDTFVRGCIEALSTMHRPFGLMHELVQQGAVRRIFRWGLLEVIERCDPARPCEDCKLWEDCGALARTARGFLPVDDALMQKRRTGGPEWAAEMLCRQPSRSDCVYPMFDAATHVRPLEPGDANSGTWIAGMDFGFRSPTVVLWAHLAGDGSVHVVDEHVASELTIEQHLGVIRSRSAGRTLEWIGIDPAGFQRHEHSGTSSAALLMRAGFTIRARRSEVQAGVRAVGALLRSADGRVRLRVDPRCERLIESLQTYHYPPQQPRSLEPVKDGSDHACDALRYLVTNLDRQRGKANVVSY
ncbi:MAG: hypothetical protein IT430_05960 [Phycisphaerales bacterium]|nr:hypothetical protein [Phycisphaerales bacterium]